MAFLLGECLLQSWLNKANMNHAEFARRMGVSRSYVGKLASGKKRMSLEFAINAAFTLDCRASDFYILKPKPRTAVEPKKQ